MGKKRDEDQNNEQSSENEVDEWPTRSLDELTRHQFHTEIYGSVLLEEDFVQSVREKGVIRPVLITPDGTIIGGYRRVKAAKEAELDEVRVRVVEFDSKSAERAAIIHLNKQRTKTFSQKMREAVALEKIEGVDWEQLDDDPEEASLQNFARSEVGNPRTSHPTNESLGKRFDWSRETYRKARRVWKWGEEEGVAKLQEEIQEIDDGDQSIHGAHRILEDFDRENRLEVQAEDESNVENRDISSRDKSERITSYEIHFERWLQQELDEWLEDLGKKTGWAESLQYLLNRLNDRYGSHPTTEAAYMFTYKLEKEGYGELTQEDNAEMLPVMERKPPDETLKRLYHEEERTRAEIAVRRGVHKEIVTKWLLDAEIPIRQDEDHVEMPPSHQSRESEDVDDNGPSEPSFS